MIDRLPKDLRFFTAQYLTDKEVAKLSRLSTFFRKEIKEIGYWRRKFISAGCSQLLFKQIIESNAVSDYKNLYRVFLEYRDYYSWDMYDLLNAEGQIREFAALFCLSGDVKLVQYVIEKNIVNANYLDSNGNNALHLTAMSNSVECMREVKKIPGLDLTICNNEGDHALHMTASRGSLLTLREAMNIPELDLKIKDLRGNTALHLLIQRDCSPEEIREVGKIPNLDINGLNCWGEGVLEIAITKRPIEIIKEVVKLPGINLAAKFNSGNLLHLAVKRLNYEIIIFIRCLALTQNPPLDFNKPNKYGETPYSSLEKIHAHACEKITPEKGVSGKILDAFDALLANVQPLVEEMPEEKSETHMDLSLS